MASKISFNDKLWFRYVSNNQENLCTYEKVSFNIGEDTCKVDLVSFSLMRSGGGRIPKYVWIKTTVRQRQFLKHTLVLIVRVPWLFYNSVVPSKCKYVRTRFPFSSRRGLLNRKLKTSQYFLPRWTFHLLHKLMIVPTFPISYTSITRFPPGRRQAALWRLT